MTSKKKKIESLDRSTMEEAKGGIPYEEPNLTDMDDPTGTLPSENDPTGTGTTVTSCMDGSSNSGNGGCLSGFRNTGVGSCGSGTSNMEH